IGNDTSFHCFHFTFEMGDSLYSLTAFKMLHGSRWKGWVVETRPISEARALFHCYKRSPSRVFFLDIVRFPYFADA
ncbi:MAG: hypothetical protein Q6353_012060, partial [Candidatus Sigynarchaeum springense]